VGVLRRDCECDMPILKGLVDEHLGRATLLQYSKYEISFERRKSGMIDTNGLVWEVREPWERRGDSFKSMVKQLKP